LRTETVGGLVLLGAAVLALVWAKNPLPDAHERIGDFHVGIPALGLDLSVGHWASDGLLTVFLLVAGIELSSANSSWASWSRPPRRSAGDRRSSLPGCW
jgi:NhaA family Na+:H+ antiporter